MRVVMEASVRVRVDILEVEGILVGDRRVAWQAPFYTFRRALSLALGRQDNLNRHRGGSEPMAVTSRHCQWSWNNWGLEPALLGDLTSGPWMEMLWPQTCIARTGRVRSSIVRCCVVTASESS